MKTSDSTIHLCAALILAIVAFGLFMGLMYEVLQPKGRVSCADFGPYDYPGALSALQHGATWLDHNKSGVPCEELRMAWMKEFSKN